jgi:hypothetical protein
LEGNQEGVETMSEQILPGDGWRLLGPDELTKQGDESWRMETGTFKPFDMVFGFRAGIYYAVRRRIPAKPEAMEIETESGPVSLAAGFHGQAWIMQQWDDETERVRLSETTQIRQVIAWLQQVAEWREAQDSK